MNRGDVVGGPYVPPGAAGDAVRAAVMAEVAAERCAGVAVQLTRINGGQWGVAIDAPRALTVPEVRALQPVLDARTAEAAVRNYYERQGRR